MRPSVLNVAITFALACVAGGAIAQSDPAAVRAEAASAAAAAAQAEVLADDAESNADAADAADAPEANAAEKRADAAEDAADAAGDAAELAEEAAEDVSEGKGNADIKAGEARAGADVASAGAAVAADAAAGNAGVAGETPAADMSAEQKATMEAWQNAGKVGPEHERLAAFVGEWDAKVMMWMDPAQPPMQSTGTESTTLMFGGRFVKSEFRGSFQGEAFEGVSTMGYDNVRDKYTSTWQDSMGTGTFLSMGDYDDASRSYTLRGMMADAMKPGELMPVRQVIRVADDDHHVFEQYETRAGEESKTLEIAYTRR